MPSCDWTATLPKESCGCQANLAGNGRWGRYAVLMDPKIKAIFFGLAIIVFVLDGLGVTTRVRVGLLSIGLALFAFPFFWDALVAGF